MLCGGRDGQPYSERRDEQQAVVLVRMMRSTTIPVGSGSARPKSHVQEALRPFAIPPGNYMLPRAHGRAELASPTFVEKLNKGPVGLVCAQLTAGVFGWLWPR